jgi:16S rRNA (uracil1498-N3)-methyltransferase
MQIGITWNKQAGSGGQRGRLLAGLAPGRKVSSVPFRTLPPHVPKMSRDPVESGRLTRTGCASHLPPMRANYKMQRLFVRHVLSSGTAVSLGPEQSHYLLHVLRLGGGAEVLLFNGEDGEWLARLGEIRKKAAVLDVVEQTRVQDPRPDLLYCFAPLKVGRLDYVIQKAVEMGAGTLQPVITQHTQMTRIGTDRLQANAVEAAEQCGILALPEVREPVKFERLLADWSAERRLIFCDESAAGNNPLPLLRSLPKAPLAVLVGPEGGFSEAERRQLHALPFVQAIPLGPRILRADTAAVAALAVVQATIGDW